MKKINELVANWADIALAWLITHGLQIIIIILGAYIVNWISDKIIRRVVRLVIITDGFTLPNKAEAKREQTLIRIFIGATQVLIFIITITLILQEVGIMVVPILAGVSIVGIAVGFGGQYLMRDIITGLFIILENQYRIGDVVNFDGVGGLVEDISLRMTTIRDLDGTVYHIPHGEIKKVANLTKVFSRVNINIGVAYNSDIEKVISVVNEVGNTLAEDPQWKEAIIKAPQFLRIDNFADSAIIIKILGDTQPIKQWEVAGELRKRLKIAFDKQGIEIPFPQREVHHKVKSV
jgi:small conductance mechanosensitive channel